MRMRKKKHTDDRIAACGEYLVADPASLKGRWQEKAGGRKICLEIGCGKGTFTCEMAKRHPEYFFVAVEKVRDVIVMAMEKAKAENLSNLVFMDADAETLDEVFAPGELDRLYLNFSDPWPKKKHARRRLTYRSFLAIYRRLLAANGAVYFKTDNRRLFDFSVAEFTACDYILCDLTYDLHHSSYEKDNIHTEYENTFSEKGFRINRVVAYPW